VAASAPAAAVAPPVGAGAAYAPREEAADAAPKAKQEKQQQQQPADLDQQRKRADNLAHTNQCDAAIKAYGDLERRTQLTPRERVNVARCLGLLGKPEQAQQLLDALKQDKNADGNMVQQAEREMKAQANRRSASPPVAAKKAAKPKPAKPEGEGDVKLLQPAF
jgi:hypothetical protein